MPVARKIVQAPAKGQDEKKIGGQFFSRRHVGYLSPFELSLYNGLWQSHTVACRWQLCRVVCEEKIAQLRVECEDGVMWHLPGREQ